MRISSLSTEYVLVPVLAPEDPTEATVEMAFTTSADPIESEWRPASWGSEGSKIWASCLVGPEGTGALAEGDYQVWIRINSSPARPVLLSGPLTVV